MVLMSLENSPNLSSLADASAASWPGALHHQMSWPTRGSTVSGFSFQGWRQAFHFKDGEEWCTGGPPGLKARRPWNIEMRLTL